MNWLTGVLVAVKLLAAPPNRPPDAPDLFCLIAATSNDCAWRSAVLANAARTRRFMLRLPHALRRASRLLGRRRLRISATGKALFFHVRSKAVDSKCLY